MNDATLPKLTTISALARRSGVPKTSMWRRLKRLHERSSDKSWLVRDGRNWSVNLERLKSIEPHYADAPNVAEMVEDHEDRLVVLERIALEARKKAALR